jgi:hypothetical protein
MIIAVSGLTFDKAGNKGSAGAGKSTVADRLVAKYGFVSIGFADPMKRFCQEIFEFDDVQLWGESDKRNAPDTRYLRKTGGVEQHRDVTLRDITGFTLECGPIKETKWDAEFLTPRYALQILGTEFGRHCYPDVWVAYAMRVAIRVLSSNDKAYYPDLGLVRAPHGYSLNGVVFSDLRFKNEMEYVKGNGGKVVRVRRPVEKVGDSSHQSENDLNDVPDEAFDYVIHGQPTDVYDLQLRTDEMLDWLKGNIRPFNEAQETVPPFMRG